MHLGLAIGGRKGYHPVRWQWSARAREQQRGRERVREGDGGRDKQTKREIAHTNRSGEHVQHCVLSFVEKLALEEELLRRTDAGLLLGFLLSDFFFE